MRKLVVGLMVLGLAAAGAKTAEAQFRFGAQLSWGDDTDFGIGARANFGLGGLSQRNPIEGQVTFDYFFPDGYDYWELTGNALYRFDTPSESVKPYAGGGVIFAHSSVDVLGVSDSNSDLGLNLVGGLRFHVKGTTTLPFVEARFEIKDGSQFVLAAGVMFGKP